jgi:PAS domain S-box-containing protein
MEEGYRTENQLVNNLELNDIRSIIENISESALLLIPVWGKTGSVTGFSLDYANPQAKTALQTGTENLSTVNLESLLRSNNLSQLFDIALLSAAEKRIVKYPSEELKALRNGIKVENITSARAIPVKAGIIIIFTLSAADNDSTSGSITDQTKTGSDNTDAALEELKRQKNILITILETLPVGVWMLDENGVIRDANKKAREIWGGIKAAGPENYTVYKAFDYKTGEELPNERRSSYKALRGISTYLEPVKIINFEGESKIILNSAVPIFGEEKRITGAIIVNQDVTNLMKISEELKMSEERFRMLFENMNEGCFIADVIYDSKGEPADFRYFEINEAFARMLGLNRNDIIGKTYSTLVSKTSPENSSLQLIPFTFQCIIEMFLKG